MKIAIVHSVAGLSSKELGDFLRDPGFTVSVVNPNQDGTTNFKDRQQVVVMQAQRIAAGFADQLFTGFSNLMEGAKNRGDIQEVAYIKSLRDLFSEVVRAFVHYPYGNATTDATPASDQGPKFYWPSCEIK